MAGILGIYAGELVRGRPSRSNVAPAALSFTWMNIGNVELVLTDAKRLVSSKAACWIYTLTQFAGGRSFFHNYKTVNATLRTLNCSRSASLVRQLEVSAAAVPLLELAFFRIGLSPWDAARKMLFRCGQGISGVSYVCPQHFRYRPHALCPSDAIDPALPSARLQSASHVLRV